MAKTKASVTGKAAVPSAEALSKLAQKFRAEKEPEEPRPDERPTISELEVMDAEAYNPSLLPFQLKWENFEKLKKFHDFTEQETCTLLLAMVGASPEGKHIWGKFDVPKKLFPEAYLEIQEMIRLEKAAPAAAPAAAVRGGSSLAVKGGAVVQTQR